MYKFLLGINLSYIVDILIDVLYNIQRTLVLFYARKIVNGFQTSFQISTLRRSAASDSGAYAGDTRRLVYAGFARSYG